MGKNYFILFYFPHALHIETCVPHCRTQWWRRQVKSQSPWSCILAGIRERTNNEQIHICQVGRVLWRKTKTGKRTENDGAAILDMGGQGRFWGGDIWPETWVKWESKLVLYLGTGHSRWREQSLQRSWGGNEDGTTFPLQADRPLRSFIQIDLKQLISNKYGSKLNGIYNVSGMYY